MTPELVEALAQLGVAAVVFGLAFHVFYRMHHSAMIQAAKREEAHSEEREEWRKSNQEQAEKVSRAIDNLAYCINADKLEEKVAFERNNQ